MSKVCVSYTEVCVHYSAIVMLYMYYIGHFTYVYTYYRGTVLLHRSVFYNYVNVLCKSTYAAGV